MVKLKLTKTVNEKLKSILEVYRSELPSELLITLQPQNLDTSSSDIEGIHWIHHGTIVDLIRLTRLSDRRAGRENRWSLAELLKGVEIYISPKPIRHRSSELEKIINSIKLNQEKDEYERMISSSSSSSSFLKDQIFNDNEKQDWNYISRSITLLINSLFSILGIVVSIYWLGYVNYSWSIEKTLVWCLFGALGLGSVELVLCWNYL
ncbi:endoplasmic reticulum-based factor for assembly of V-ATPase-domain-containing protein [Melampsora americana]|nr:endoplasmic reticulum-based factor for assembly of V-ATPase-domain-containing protein [Melampsora americana]